MQTVKERFLRYVAIDTMSEDGIDRVPSTDKQFELARLLWDELLEMGASKVRLDEEHCYVYALIPATEGCDKPSLGFIAHIDTSPALSGANIKARCIKDYDGGDVLLNEEMGIIMSVKDFPYLKSLKGQELIVTDGTTLLGADDKAGVAEIMAMAEYLLSHPEIPHGDIAIGFTPDEEVGRGADFFDIQGFGAKAAYTVDGGEIGEVEDETFNAASAKVTVNGKSIHPGSAKGKMLNALLVAMELQSLLPAFDNPMYTEGYEGFFHLDNMSGTVEKAAMDYIIRDHDRDKFLRRKELFADCCAFLNRKYGEGTVVPLIRDSYYNMYEVLKDHEYLTENACEAMRAIGVEPVVRPIRGGTDGSRLSFSGLPCPNLCTGGYNFHGKYECITVEAMEKVVELLITLAKA